MCHATLRSLDDISIWITYIIRQMDYFIITRMTCRIFLTGMGLHKQQHGLSIFNPSKNVFPGVSWHNAGSVAEDFYLFHCWYCRNMTVLLLFWMLPTDSCQFTNSSILADIEQYLYRLTLARHIWEVKSVVCAKMLSLLINMYFKRLLTFLLSNICWNTTLMADKNVQKTWWSSFWLWYCPKKEEKWKCKETVCDKLSFNS